MELPEETLIDPNEMMMGEATPQEEVRDPQSPEEVNIAEGMKEDELKQIARDCIEVFKSDLDSRTSW